MIVLDHYPLVLTLEPPWLNNQPNISCIPAGSYDLVPWLSPSLKINTLKLENVPNRSGILFHSGNDAGGVDTDSQGCILVGLQFGKVGGKSQKMGLLQSKIAFSKLIEVVKTSNLASLEIVNCF